MISLKSPIAWPFECPCSFPDDSSLYFSKLQSPSANSFPSEVGAYIQQTLSATVQTPFRGFYRGLYRGYQGDTRSLDYAHLGAKGRRQNPTFPSHGLGSELLARKGRGEWVAGSLHSPKLALKPIQSPFRGTLVFTGPFFGFLCWFLGV